MNITRTDLAHSKNESGKSQCIYEHTINVIEISTNSVKSTKKYFSCDTIKFVYETVVKDAALLHDFGKVDLYQQQVLLTGSKIYPYNHVDAGTVITTQYNKFSSAIIVNSHHLGLPDLPMFNFEYRDKKTILENGLTQEKHTNNHIEEYKNVFEENGLYFPNKDKVFFPKDSSPMYYRFALSELNDADFTDSAVHFQKETRTDEITLNVDPIYNSLVNHMNNLYSHKLSLSKTQETKKRIQLRRDLFNECDSEKLIKQGYRIVTLPTPVGSGKTYSAFVNMLRAASLLKLRRIIVVLPYTSIIDQSVKEYIEALKLLLVNSDVDVNDVVTGNHHKLEFNSFKHRHLSINWKTQIIITTSVQFFETLASNKSRKLHYVPGSAIFLDEFHTLPLNVFKLSWQWLKTLSQEFGCYIILGSGTLVKGWELKEFGLSDDIPSLVGDELINKLTEIEKNRISYETIGEISFNDFIKRMLTYKNKESCLVVCDTVNNAAIVALELKSNNVDVEHLSTALCPFDRRNTLLRILDKLEKKIPFYLVATSCIDSGMDFSFQVGYRERCSVESLLQTGGRVNRNCEYLSAKCYDFVFKKNNILTTNTAYVNDRKVLSNILLNGGVDYTKITQYTQEKFRIQTGTIIDKNEELLKFENSKSFRKVKETYKIISNSTSTILVNKDIGNRIKNGEFVNQRELENYCITVFDNKMEKLNTEILIRDNGNDLFYLTGPYDNFIGYMKSLL